VIWTNLFRTLTLAEDLMYRLGHKAEGGNNLHISRHAANDLYRKLKVLIIIIYTLQDNGQKTSLKLAC